MAKRVTGFENAFWRGPLLKNELRIEPEHFRIRFESAFSCGPLVKFTFESDSKAIFCLHLPQKEPWALAREVLLAWISRRLDFLVSRNME